MKINKTYASLLGSIALLSANNAQATITTYTDKAIFLSLLQAGYWEDQFNDLTYGGIVAPSTTRSSAEYTVTYTAPANGLYTTTGAISTNTATDHLIATMEGENIFAVGGDFFLTDFNGDFQSYAGFNVTAFASNGINPDSPLLTATNSISNFFGWISSTPITSVTVSAGGVTPYRWNTVDNLIVGALYLESDISNSIKPAPADAPPLNTPILVPEPDTLVMIVLAGIALNRKLLGLKSV